MSNIGRAGLMCLMSLLAQFGKIPEHDYSSLRIVFFAGEVFPIEPLKRLHQLWLGSTLWNQGP